MDDFWSAILAAGAVAGIVFGALGYSRYRYEKERREREEKYKEGMDEGTLQRDIKFIKSTITEVLHEQKDFRKEQEKINKCFDRRLIVVETRLDIKSDVKGE